MRYSYYQGVASEGSNKLALIVSAVLLACLAVFIAITQSVGAASNTVTVTGNTSAGENQPGWMFNRDIKTSTPYEFSTNRASLGLGSLYVKPISNTNTSGISGNDPNKDKFIAENFVQTPVSTFDSVGYDFLIAGPTGTASDASEFYLNVYANIDNSNNYYDCRYDYVPSAGSTSVFTNANFTSIDVPADVVQRGDRISTCPPTLAQMPAGSYVRAVAINVGGTSGTDTGLAGYLDNVVVGVNGDTTTYDFERYVRATGQITSPSTGQEVSGTLNLAAVYDDGDSVNEDAVQWAVRKGTCSASTGTVAGNVDGYKDVSTWNGARFSATLNVSTYAPGDYCFVFNPTDEPGQNNVRETVEFKIITFAAVTKEDCKNNRWEVFGADYKNQGQCVASVTSSEKRKLNR